jgi:hypothetical protein
LEEAYGVRGGGAYGLGLIGPNVIIGPYQYVAVGRPMARLDSPFPYRPGLGPWKLANMKNINQRGFIDNTDTVYSALARSTEKQA